MTMSLLAGLKFVKKPPTGAEDGDGDGGGGGGGEKSELGDGGKDRKKDRKKDKKKDKKKKVCGRQHGRSKVGSPLEILW